MKRRNQGDESAEYQRIPDCQNSFRAVSAPEDSSDLFRAMTVRGDRSGGAQSEPIVGGEIALQNDGLHQDKSQ